MYLFGLCQVLATVQGIFSCSMWGLVPWAGIELGPPAVGARSLSHWTAREVPLKVSSCSTLYTATPAVKRMLTECKWHCQDHISISSDFTNRLTTGKGASGSMSTWLSAPLVPLQAWWREGRLPTHRGSALQSGAGMTLLRLLQWCRWEARRASPAAAALGRLTAHEGQKNKTSRACDSDQVTNWTSCSNI